MIDDIVNKKKANDYIKGKENNSKESTMQLQEAYRKRSSTTTTTTSTEVK